MILGSSPPREYGYAEFWLQRATPSFFVATRDPAGVATFWRPATPATQRPCQPCWYLHRNRVETFEGFKGRNKPFQAGEEKFPRNQFSRMGEQIICVVSQKRIQTCSSYRWCGHAECQRLGVRSSPHNFRLDFTCLRVLKNNFQNPETSKICPDSNDFRKHLHKTSSNIQTLTVCNGSLTVIKLHQRWTHLNYALCPLLLPSQYTCTYSEKIWSIIFGIFHFWKFLLVP